MTFDFWLSLSCFFRPRQRWRLPLIAMKLDFRIVLKNPCLSPLMTQGSESISVKRRLMMCWHTWSSFSSLGTIFVQTLSMPKSSEIIFQTVSFFMSITRNSHRRSSHTTCLIWSMLTSVLLVESPSGNHLSHPFTPLWTSCVTQKHVRTIWCYLYMLADVFQVFEMDFSPIGPKISGLLIARYLFFVAHS